MMWRIPDHTKILSWVSQPQDDVTFYLLLEVVLIIQGLVVCRFGYLLGSTQTLFSSTTTTTATVPVCPSSFRPSR